MQTAHPLPQSGTVSGARKNPSAHSALGIDRARATLPALFDGVVAAVNVNPGTIVSASTVAVTVIDRSTLHLALNLSESDAATVQVGQPVQVSFDALPNTTVKGTVTNVAPNSTTVQNVVTCQVLVSIDPGKTPLSTAQRKLFGGRAIGGSGSTLVSTVVIQAKDQNSVTAALNEVNATLRDQYHLPADGSADDFSVINQQDILATATQTTQILTIFLAAIAGISLLVGGIGIMNIMLVSVRERTREIGLRKAIGARENDILFQFMIEALSLSLVGGLIGVGLGASIAEGVSLAGVTKAVIAPSSVILALGFAMAVGLFFGIAPARSAARLDPIEALRQD